MFFELIVGDFWRKARHKDSGALHGRECEYSADDLPVAVAVGKLTGAGKFFDVAKAVRK